MALDTCPLAAMKKLALCRVVYLTHMYDRVAQFMKDLIMTRDYYVRYEGCILTREEVCHINEFLAVD